MTDVPLVPIVFLLLPDEWWVAFSVFHLVLRFHLREVDQVAWHLCPVLGLMGLMLQNPSLLSYGGYMWVSFIDILCLF